MIKLFGNFIVSCKIIILFMNMMFLVTILSSCKDYNKEYQSELPSGLQDALTRLQELRDRRDKCSLPETKVEIEKLEKIIEYEVQTHRELIFRQQLKVLQDIKKDVRLAQKVTSIQPLYSSGVDKDLFDFGGVFELFNMMPLTLTPYLTSYIDKTVLETIRTEQGCIKLLDVSDDTCQTAIEYSKYVFVASFQKEVFKWRPVEVKLYEKPQK